MGETSSITHVVSEHRPRRREKGKERARDVLVDSSSSQKAGPSKPSKLEGKKRVQKDNVSWNCIPVARSEVSSIPPVWSRDGRFYFTAAHTSIFIHSSTTPNFERLSTLSSTDNEGHRKPITALILHPTNPLQLITSSDDGSVKVWDWVEGRHVRTIKFADDGAVRQICVGQVGDKWWIFGTVTNRKQGVKFKEDGSHIQHRVMRVPLLPQSTPTSDQHKPVAYLYLIGKLRREPTAIMLSPRKTYLVALAGTKAYVYRLPTTVTDDKWKPHCVKFVSDEQFTCGAFAPDRKSGSTQEEWFATGDERGVIRLWHGLGAAFRQLDAAAVQAQQAESAEKPLYPDTEKRLPTTSLHWHAHAVAALAFTSGGAQILSVGEESVLVQWHLNSGKREYIPRLGGRPILSVSVRPGARGVEEEYWMGFADGAILRVGAASGSVATVGQGVRLDPLRPTSTRKYPIAIHPSSKALVVPSSHPSTLQFIDPLASTVLFDLEVTPSNRVSRRDDKELEPVAVEHVSFSEPRDGRSEWMATVEGRPADEIEGGGLVKTLKFWRWSGDKYIVNTQYPRPHGTEDITALAFAPLRPDSEPHVLTASIGGTVKLWQVRQAKKSEHGKAAMKKNAVFEYYWTTRSTFSYRSLSVHAAAFSPDATIVALAHGTTVTLWDAVSNILIRALESVVDSRKIIFAGSEGRNLIVGGDGKGVAVWDILSCQVVQTLPIHSVDILLSLPSGFITSQSDSSSTTLSFFTPSGSLSRSVSLKTAFKALTSLPSPNVHLVGISPSGEISRFGESQSSVAPSARNINSTTAPARRATSIWQEMFGKDAFLDDVAPAPEPSQSAVAVSALQRRAAGNPAQVFDGPSHTLPPVSMLFDAFIDELLGLSTDNVDGEAQFEGETINFEEPASAIASTPLIVTSEEVRSIRDTDVTELEVFFRGLLASAPAKAPKPKTSQVNGHANGVVNGLSTPAKIPNGPAAAVTTPETDEPQLVVEGKRKSKKRKAPRGE